MQKLKDQQADPIMEKLDTLIDMVPLTALSFL